MNSSPETAPAPARCPPARTRTRPSARGRSPAGAVAPRASRDGQATQASRHFATTTSVTSRRICGTAAGTVPGSISVPTATKNSTANTSRNGSRRRRASAVSARSLIARPATNAARAVGTPNNTPPARGDREARRDRDDQEQVVLRAQSAEDERQDLRRHDGEHAERDQQGDRDRQRPALRAGRGDDDRPEGHARHVLEHAPAEQALLGGLVGGPAARARDVDDDDRARHRHRQPHERRAERRQPDGVEDGRRDRRREPDLERRRPQEPAVFAAEAAEVDLDPHLEQEQHHADLGHQLDLVAVRLVAGRERRHGEAGREVPDDRREPELARHPPERGREQQREADVEDEVGRLHRPRIAAGNQRARRRGLRAPVLALGGWVRRGARGRLRSRPAPPGFPGPWGP